MKKIFLSQYFPASSPMKGQPTYHVELFLNSLHLQGKITDEMKQRIVSSLSLNLKKDLLFPAGNAIALFKDHSMMAVDIDIAAGDVVDVYALDHEDEESKIFSGLTIEHVQKFEVINSYNPRQFGIYVDGGALHPHQVEEIAFNSGMMKDEMLSMMHFPKTFSGTIVCWNKATRYEGRKKNEE